MALLARLNCREYKNWMKAGHCLLILQSRLQGYIDGEMQRFHQQLGIRAPRQRRRCQCRARGKQFEPGCPVCAVWKELILAHHNNRNGEIYWGNSNPSLWPTHYWEVAKVYMPRGQAQIRGPKQCDAAALLNLINNCDYFRVPNLSRVREIIKCRNELMHSCDMTVSTPWLTAFGQKMYDLVTEFKHVPGLVRECDKMQEVLLTDWNVEDLGINEFDGLPPAGKFVLQGPVAQMAASLSSLSPYEVEIQLIQELIQEMYLEIEEQSSLTKEDEDKVSKIKNFLCQNEDLKFAFQKDIKKLDSLCKTHDAEGWSYTQLSASFFTVFSLVILTAIFLGQKN
ncbi:uncharacterized protein CXorf38 homolog [Bufo bufo]|uniref:uncharacterized protein CXorf38 homolog n=1 Tax=Bufo bufo TaxID=8384 RepID=UPI001ABEE7AB|nr:uncharacterized protein CXorf38 homolog [Bufo bufo]